VVDDEELIRRMSTRILRRAGFEVLLAGDGDEALQVFDAHADLISVVLLDASMPRLSGGETLVELRRRRPGLPVLLSSGHAEGPALMGTAGERPTGFVQKPYGMLELVVAVAAATRAGSGQTRV
jgi:DNA-binding response OmpR family regulator